MNNIKIDIIKDEIIINQWVSNYIANRDLISFVKTSVIEKTLHLLLSFVGFVISNWTGFIREYQYLSFAMIIIIPYLIMLLAPIKSLCNALNSMREIGKEKFLTFSYFNRLIYCYIANVLNIDICSKMDYNCILSALKEKVLKNSDYEQVDINVELIKTFTILHFNKLNIHFNESFYTSLSNYCVNTLLLSGELQQVENKYKYSISNNIEKIANGINFCIKCKNII